MLPDLSDYEPAFTRQGMQASLWMIVGTMFLSFTMLGAWIIFDLMRSYDKVILDVSYRAMQRSQIIGQAFRTEILAADYVLRDVLGRVQEADLVFPDSDANHARRLTGLLKDKADTVPDFVSMVLFNRDCVFVATVTGKNTGVRSKPALCNARRSHLGPGPLVSYVSGRDSASRQSVLVLSRNFLSPAGEFLGGVMSVIELDRAQNRFASYSLGPGDSVAMLDDTQVLLARRPQLADVIENRVGTPEIPAMVLSKAPGTDYSMQRDVDGNERLFGFSKIEGFPFVIAYGFDKAKVLQDWQRRALELGIAYCTLLLLAGMAARSHWITLLQRDELMANRTALQELATHDPLTGLYNRRFLDATVAREFARSQRDGAPLAVIMLDLDHFKQVNDDYSHAAGDEVLKTLAELLKKGLRESDMICRYGGEEFIAIMPKMAIEQALERVESWRKQMEETLVVYGEFTIHITLSAGIAMFPDHGINPVEVFRHADEMLYKSKREGRNRISVFTQ